MTELETRMRAMLEKTGLYFGEDKWLSAELAAYAKGLELVYDTLSHVRRDAFVQTAEEDWYITFRHPMEKDHSIRFAALVGLDRLLVVRLYPEQGGEVRIPQLRGGGKLYLCCSRDGLYEISLPRRRPVRSGRLPKAPEP